MSSRAAPTTPSHAPTCWPARASLHTPRVRGVQSAASLVVRSLLVHLVAYVCCKVLTCGGVIGLRSSNENLHGSLQAAGHVFELSCVRESVPVRDEFVVMGSHLSGAPQG